MLRPTLPVLAPFVLSILSLAPAIGQGTAADYKRAATLAERAEGGLRPFPRVRWIPEGGGVVWREKAADGKHRYVRVDANGERSVDASPSALGLSSVSEDLEPLGRRTRSKNGGEATTMRFINELDFPVRLYWIPSGGGRRAYGTIAPGGEHVQSTFAGHAWVLLRADEEEADEPVGFFMAEPFECTARIDAASRRRAREKPRRKGREEEPEVSTGLSLRDFNVFLRAKGKGGRSSRELQLTSTGTEQDSYLPPRLVSPTGTHVLGFQQTTVETRRVPLLDSTPDDAVQPALEWLDYRKPGDPLPQRRPRLFDLEKRREVPVDDEPFADSYRVAFRRWSPDGARAYVLYNARGHQRLVLYAIEARTGEVRAIVDERSDTFVDYSQKTMLHWLDEAGELLWASERDGHNHLYRIDAETGEVRAQVTRGDFVVRRIVHVDEEAGRVWFSALGLRAGEDPYHEHLARVDLDGTGLVRLTEGDGTHAWEFDEERELFIDRWSRVDQPEVTELRRADGTLVAELGRDDDAGLRRAGFQPPQRFVAKGRDGKTDIHGILIRPTNFDPTRRYPVIEAIYAGPHGFHVPKTYGRHLGRRRLAELGFIVAQIDGMGTNWRSKAFHDVCWQNLKDSGLPDRIAWLRAAAEQHPELDLSRVGIYGGSAGGQNALAALLHHGDFYSAAAADCGCHDNRMDKIWWNEAWMGAMGPHYAESSNVTHAHRLKGKLLLTVGELDRNVDPASTLQVVDALVRAEKDFEFVLVPGAGHGVGEGDYLFRRRQDFFVRALYGLEPRRP